MRRAAYERTGGVRGAVGRLAEATYARLSEPERTAARRILLRLADAGEQEARSCVAACRSMSSSPAATQATAAALAALTDSRLVTADEGTLEVAHEALLREWPRLRGWLEEDAEGRRIHQHLIHAASDWQAGGRDPGELYRGARLASALEWVAGHEGDLNELERPSSDESRAEAEQEAEHQRRGEPPPACAAGRARRPARAGARGRRGRAQPARRGPRRRADARTPSGWARRRSAKSASIDALLLTRAAVELDDSLATRGNLLSVLLRAPAALGVVDHGWPMYGAALSPDGRMMAIGDERGAYRLRRLHPAAARPALLDQGRSDPERPLLARRRRPGDQLAGPEATPQHAGWST